MNRAMRLSPFAAWKEVVTRNSWDQDMYTPARISHKIGELNLGNEGVYDLFTGGAPELNESRIHEVPKNGRVIFHMGKVLEL